MAEQRSVSEIILASIAQGAAWVSAAGAIVFANEKLARLVDRSVNGLLGVSLHELVAPRDRDTLGRLLHPLRGGGERRLELLAGARSLPVAATVAPLPAGQSICLFTDMTLLHELRNTLTPIKTSAFALQRLEGMPQSSALGLEIIDQQAEKLLRLLDAEVKARK